jgi:hypothetical protein
VSGEVQSQRAGGTIAGSGGLPASNPCVTSYYAHETDPRLARDLTVVLSFRVWSAADPTSAPPAFVDLRLTVHDVPEGASEIDLDDDRAEVEGWSGVGGHLSVSRLERDCSHGNLACVTTLDATFAVTATNTSGDSVTVGPATLELRERYVIQDVMCMPGDGIGA